MAKKKKQDLNNKISQGLVVSNDLISYLISRLLDVLLVAVSFPVVLVETWIDIVLGSLKLILLVPRQE